MIPVAWQDILGKTLPKELETRVLSAYETAVVYPPKEQIFSALSLTKPQDVRVVILGQDPYHGAGQAHGLAFSVPVGAKFPPSLRNILKELEDDLHLTHGCDLTHWATQGVLLLNTVLTVEEGKPTSHEHFGWQEVTDTILRGLSSMPQPMAFILWGAHAQKKREIVANSEYPRLILESPHPSPLSSYRGFFGSKPFSKVNDFLQKHGETPILWGE
ncbi:MAG: uracil-DNA glycosylase [Oscillospiraceae bacterium]|nr:uracil-DNA glycosylase [Oscillospiraceae bacterium]